MTNKIQTNDAYRNGWDFIWGGWYCPTCGKYIDPNEVTYEETHDVQCGGCGGDVE